MLLLQSQFVNASLDPGRRAHLLPFACILSSTLPAFVESRARRQLFTQLFFFFFFLCAKGMHFDFRLRTLLTTYMKQLLQEFSRVKSAVGFAVRNASAVA
jgi:hypothetical protein